MAFNILVVDDEELALSTAKVVLEQEPEFVVHTASGASEAIRLVRSQPYLYAVVLLDLQMPEKDGAATAQELLAINPHLIVAINSGDYSRDALKKCFASGVVDFIEKDTDPEELRAKIRSFCKKFEETAQTFVRPTLSDNEKLIQSLGMVGRSQGMVEIANLVQQAAPSDCTILIHGESGTGKELVARAIHKLSARRTRPFIAVNVAAIPENLLESDLFGHERGSFTGADRQKIGKFKVADGGTIFLDEIGDMKPDLQVKLLRVLQEGEISPVGSVAPQKIDVRIVAASHVDLDKAVAEGKFREDLFYRLNVLKIRIPPLRERPEDIQPLVAHFQRVFGGEKKTLLMKTIRYMERYHWRGNIRELENEMEKLMTIIPSNRIEPSHLSSKFFEGRTPSKLNDFDCTYEEFITLLEGHEKQYILNNILKSSSLREAAKHRMKVPWATIYGRMKKLGIKGEEEYEKINQ